MPTDLDNVEIANRPGGIELSIKVVPGASRTRVVGPWGTALKVAVAAPPAGGQANKAVVGLLAQLFGVKKASVAIVAGQTKALKRLAIAGLTLGAARECLLRLADEQ